MTGRDIDRYVLVFQTRVVWIEVQDTSLQDLGQESDGVLCM